MNGMASLNKVPLFVFKIVFSLLTIHQAYKDSYQNDWDAYKSVWHYVMVTNDFAVRDGN